jgi:hypothetical protein
MILSHITLPQETTWQRRMREIRLYGATGTLGKRDFAPRLNLTQFFFGSPIRAKVTLKPESHGSLNS